jgi:hypothetical protein
MMRISGIAAFREVLQRHGLDGLLHLGCFNTAVTAAYLAMAKVDREENGPRYNWSA